jgi:hypothetical protein
MTYNRCGYMSIEIEDYAGIAAIPAECGEGGRRRPEARERPSRCLPNEILRKADGRSLSYMSRHTPSAAICQPLKLSRLPGACHEVSSKSRESRPCARSSQSHAVFQVFFSATCPILHSLASSNVHNRVVWSRCVGKFARRVPFHSSAATSFSFSTTSTCSRRQN